MGNANYVSFGVEEELNQGNSESMTANSSLAICSSEMEKDESFSSTFSAE